MLRVYPDYWECNRTKKASGIRHALEQVAAGNWVSLVQKEVNFDAGNITATGSHTLMDRGHQGGEDGYVGVVL